MEDGTLVTTDPDGRYSIPGIIPGRHLLAIDASTLPAGASATTDRVRHLKISDALLARANFGVKLPAGAPLAPAASTTGPVLQVQVVPQPSLPKPQLELRLEADAMGQGAGDGGRGQRSLTPHPSPLAPASEWHFLIHMNYPQFIHHWRLIISEGQQERRRFEGDGAPPATVAWDGTDSAGNALALHRDYRAILEVSDAEGHADTAALALRPILREPMTALAPAANSPRADDAFEIAPAAQAPRFSIPLAGAAVVSVKGTTEPSATVLIGGQQWQPDATGAFQAEVIAPPKTDRLTVEAELPSGERLAQTHPVRTSEDYFFLVALGETEIGHLKGTGRLAAIGANDRNRMEQFLYAEGRLAYYLKAKIQGKYLITSSYDIDRERKELFRQLDEDDFYPVYGDASTLNYDAANTQDKLYLMIEWDKNYAQWGNYGTGLTGTELADYNRSLHGLKAHYESLSTTPAGQPRILATVFGAKVRQQAAHDELQGTGGTLYYLRQQDVIEGSEKVLVEVRDTINQRPISRLPLAQGQDYDVDYAQGRLHLYRPLQSVSESRTITSTDLLNGNPTFLVVDYEFKPSNLALQEQAHGGRVVTTLGDHASVGATYVRQEETNTDYELRGVDATVEVWPGTTVSGEFAHSKAEAARQAVSTDGGLSFTSLTAANAAHGDAWGVRLDSKLGPSQVEASYQEIEPGFTNFTTLTRQGTSKLGFRIDTPVTPTTNLVVQHDSQRLVGDGNTQSAAQLGAQETHATSAQVVQRFGRTTLTGEYRHQERDRALARGEASSEDLFAGRVDVPVQEGLKAYASQQVSMRRPGNAQSTVGVEAQVAPGRTVAFEQTLGNLGDATQLRLTDDLGQGLSLYTNATWQRHPLDGPGLTTTSGLSKTLERGGRIYVEDEFRTASGEPSVGRIVGVETPLSDRLRLQTSFERGHTSSRTQDVSHNAAHVAMSYANPLKVTARSEAELRFLDGATNERQVTTRHEVKYQPTPDVTLQGRLEYARTENTQTSQLMARTKELHVGIAYRPIHHDRLNFLGRYIRLEDKGSSGQLDTDGLLSENSQIMSIEGAYDLGWNVELVEGLARRDQTQLISGAEPAHGATYQWLHRLNYHLTDQWDLGVEYRMLRTRQVDDFKQGVSIELDRTLWDHFQVGAGYHVTKYTEDITDTDNFKTHQWFVRLTSKFAGWTPEELARWRELREERMHQALLWRFTDARLRWQAPQELGRLSGLLSRADDALEAQHYAQATSLYEQVLGFGDEIRLRYSQALEERMTEEDRIAQDLQAAKRTLEAKDYQQAATLYEQLIARIHHLR